ncbi:hypothetical protein [uncultured Megasphaera sp.]|uniref:hypothetical protein n=1 Tax=uncultured Megasphaera sp. TaxID=165188 RepID=UPI003427AB0B
MAGIPSGVWTDAGRFSCLAVLLGAVSVGAGASQNENGRTIPQRTRQIINLAAGTEDTDAVNVAQLKEAMSDAQISIHAGEGIIVEKLGTEYTIKANLNGLSNEHGTVHILSNPEEFPYDPEQPDASPDPLNPAPRPAPRRVAAEQPEVEDGGPVHVGYVSNEVDFATDDGNTGRLPGGWRQNSRKWRTADRSMLAMCPMKWILPRTMGIQPGSTTEGLSMYWAETISIQLPAPLPVTMARPWTISTSI